MAQYDVTACIVTYNNMNTIEATLASLLEHTHGLRFQLYVVDNGSRDGTADFIEKHFPSVTLLRQTENRGFGAGQNAVLPLLDSRYHLVMNPDVTIRDNVIAKIAAYLDENPDIGMVSPKICHENGRLQVLGKRDPSLRFLFASRLRAKNGIGKTLRRYAMLDEQDENQPLDIENASGCFFVIRSELFARLKGFDEHFFLYFEDCDLSRRARAVLRLVYYPAAIVYHKWGRESKRSPKLALVQIRSMLYYFEKWKT